MKDTGNDSKLGDTVSSFSCSSVNLRKLEKKIFSQQFKRIKRRGVSKTDINWAWEEGTALPKSPKKFRKKRSGKKPKTPKNVRDDKSQDKDGKTVNNAKQRGRVFKKTNSKKIFRVTRKQIMIKIQYHTFLLAFMRLKWPEIKLHTTDSIKEIYLCES